MARSSIILFTYPQSIFRFVHHASARHMDCNSGGKAIHPSIVALCVTILSVSLSHLINLSGKKCHQQLNNSKGGVTGLKRNETIQGKNSGDTDVSKTCMEVLATPSSSNPDKQSRFKPIHREISMITPSSSHNESLRKHLRCTEQLPEPESKAKDINKKRDMAGEAATSAPCYTTIEIFGKELILALIYEDLKDKEMRGPMNQHPWSHYGKKDLRAHRFFPTSYT